MIFRIFSLPLLACAAFVIGGFVFKSTAPSRCATIMNNDVAFVLTGDRTRIPAAIKIMKRHADMQLYIIGAGTPNISDLTTEDMRRNITVESESKTTAQNAAAIRDIALGQGLNRLVLITSADHINRAALLVRRELPGTDVALCPVLLRGGTETRVKRWTIEYMKYIGTMLGLDKR
ncbi:MAG: YdcF family protein [Rickettsiales bacterium]|jgi:uncharacterized SAM-binding protein YcdF (DUF218 family)|nr:YdcF family protein [Rickettsiales bacterium]